MKIIGKKDITAVLLEHGFHFTHGQFISNTDKRQRIIFQRGRKKHKITKHYTYVFCFTNRDQVYDQFLHLRQDQPIEKLLARLQHYVNNWK